MLIVIPGIMIITAEIRNIAKTKKKNEKPKQKYQKLLNKKDPIDKRILRLAKRNELKIGIVGLGKYIKGKKKK